MSRKVPTEAPTTTADAHLSTRELSESTWPAFQELFERYGGIQAGCWCMFYHREVPPVEPIGPERTRVNRRDQEQLVRSGRSHGILVYDDARAVGWCQFGSREELPRIDRGRIYRSLTLPRLKPPLWRITCFFVDRPYRRQGIARVALTASLRAIGERGGGTVQAFPSTHPRAVAIWFGSVSMFESAGFARISPMGRSNLLMQRYVAPITGKNGALTQGRRRRHRSAASLTVRRSHRVRPSAG